MCKAATRKKKKATKRQGRKRRNLSIRRRLDGQHMPCFCMGSLHDIVSGDNVGWCLAAFECVVD